MSDELVDLTWNAPGSNVDLDVANAFATQFKNVFSSNHDNDVAKAEFEELLILSAESEPAGNHFSAELVENCLHKLKLGKACGSDELMAEHLLHAHPIIVVLLSALFRDMATHRMVPDGFCTGITVPLLKDKLGDCNDVKNYQLYPNYLNLFY